MMKHGGNVWDQGAPEDWLDFSANLRPEGTPEWVRETMRRALSDAGYYPDRQMRRARRGLAAYAGVEENCILPTAGGAAAIDLALSLSHGRVRIDRPTFGEYAERARVYGRIVTETGNIQPGDTVVLCNPNNPTGSVRRREAVLTLYRQVTRAGGELMVDEAFIDYCPEHSVRRDVAQGLMVTGSLTKILCVPGARLGYVCAAPEVIRRMEQISLPWSLNVLAGAIACELPEHQAEVVADARRNAQRRERFAAALRARGVQVEDSQAAFLLADFGTDMTRAAERLRKRHILVRTCASFGLPDTVLRLAVKTDEENERLLEALWQEM